MKIHVLISTYNRSDRLNSLVAAFKKENPCKISVFDDGSDEPYDVPPGIDYYKFDKNNGKKGYWNVVNKMLSSVDGDFFLMVPDDVEIVKGILSTLTTTWAAIEDDNKVCLSFLTDDRVKTGNWTKHKPELKEFGDIRVWHTNWNDLAFFAPVEFLDQLHTSSKSDNYIDKIHANRGKGNPKLSSGVGQQITQRKIGNMYHTETSLVSHGTHESKMNPLERKETPIVTTDRKIGGMASIPTRTETLPQVIDSIFPQLDELHVFLNGYDSVPQCLKKKGIKVYRSQDHGDMGDAGKFFTSAQATGYYFTLDDDIIYPKDYAAKMISEVERLNRKCVVGLHGIVMSPKIKSYYRDRQVYHCLSRLEQGRPVHVLGTSSVVYHTSSINVRYEDFKLPNMGDVWLGKLAQMQRVGMWAAAHGKNWIKHAKIDLSDTIFERKKNSHDEVTLVAKAIKWRLFPDQEKKAYPGVVIEVLSEAEAKLARNLAIAIRSVSAYLTVCVVDKGNFTRFIDYDFFDKVTDKMPKGHIKISPYVMLTRKDVGPALLVAQVGVDASQKDFFGNGKAADFKPIYHRDSCGKMKFEEVSEHYFGVYAHSGSTPRRSLDYYNRLVRFHANEYRVQPHIL